MQRRTCKESSFLKLSIVFVFFILTFIPWYANAEGFFQMIENAKKSGMTLSDLAADKALKATISTLPEGTTLKYDKVKAEITEGNLRLYGIVFKKNTDRINISASADKLDFNQVNVMALLSGNPSAAGKITANNVKYQEKTNNRTSIVKLEKGLARNIFITDPTKLKSPDTKITVSYLSLKSLYAKEKTKKTKVWSGNSVKAKKITFPGQIKKHSQIKFSSATVDGKNAQNVTEVLNLLMK